MLSTATQYTRDAAEVGNIGHFDNEMDMAGLENFPGIKIDNIKPQAPPAVCSAILREARSSSRQCSNAGQGHFQILATSIQLRAGTVHWHVFFEVLPRLFWTQMGGFSGTAFESL